MKTKNEEERWSETEDNFLLFEIVNKSSHEPRIRKVTYLSSQFSHAMFIYRTKRSEQGDMSLVAAFPVLNARLLSTVSDGPSGCAGTTKATLTYRRVINEEPQESTIVFIGRARKMT
jgi:hypothetical protein